MKVLATAIQGGEQLRKWNNTLVFQPLRNRWGWVAFGAYAAVIAAIYFTIAGHLIEQTNFNIEASDQKANIILAHSASGDWIPFRSSYIQPLWPWVARAVMDEDDRVFFERGRWLNFMLAFAIAVGVSAACARYVGLLPGAVLLVVVAIGVMLQRANYFHPEPLLYAFFGGTVFFMVATLGRMRWGDHIGWGCCLGLASLSKGSTEPLLLLFLGATVVVWVARLRVWPRWLVERCPEDLWSLRGHMPRAAAGLACAMVIIAPNAIYKWQTHGDPFFSPAKYWMWCDDWQTEAYPLTPRIQTKEQRDAFPPGELPSLRNYLARYGWDHMAARWKAGIAEITCRMVMPPRKWDRTLKPRMTKGSVVRGESEKVWNYYLPARAVYALLLVVAIFALWAVRLAVVLPQGGGVFTPAGLAVTAFLVAMVIGFMLLFGWYAPIGRGERFMLTLLLPMLGLTLWGGASLARRIPGTPGDLARLAFAGVLLWILWNAFSQVGNMLGDPRFGLGT